MTAEILNEQVGKYRLIRKLATGGMAHIFLAEQSGPGGFKKRLVIKRILPHLIDDEKFSQMFQDEARVAAMMNHPNIVQIFELGEDQATLYIAMEYVAGFNLRSVIQLSNDNGIWLAPEYIAKLGSQVCEGLEYAHNFCNTEGRHLNIIHRDVSPQNLMLSNQGMVKVVDFGIAKASSNAQETQAGIIKGKLAYMSPEQVKGQVLDRRSDLFSLGIVLYELATHQRPYQGKSDIDMLRAILESKPIPVDSLRPDFPPQLAQIIYRALAKDRDDRYPSAREFQWDLEQFIQSWGKPISSFQLQELVRKLGEFDAKNSPASESSPPTPRPQPSPVASPPPPPPMPTNPIGPPSGARGPAPADDFDEDGETMWATDIKIPTKRPDGPGPAALPAAPYSPPSAPGAPPVAAVSPSSAQPQWNQWDQQSQQPASFAPAPPPPAQQWAAPHNSEPEWEEDEATVMTSSPITAEMIKEYQAKNQAPASPLQPPQPPQYPGMNHNPPGIRIEPEVTGSSATHELPSAPTIMDQPMPAIPAPVYQGTPANPSWSPNVPNSSLPTQAIEDFPLHRAQSKTTNRSGSKTGLVLGITALLLLVGAAAAYYFFFL